MRHARHARHALVILLAMPAVASAQSFVQTYTQVRQRVDDPFYSQHPTLVDFACSGSAAGTGGLLSAIVPACNIVPPAGGNPAGTAVAYGTAIYDPAAGALRAGAGAHLDNFTLSQFIGTYDPITGDRIYTGAVRPDMIDVISSVVLNDRFTLTSFGATAASMSFVFDYNGSLKTDIASGSSPFQPDVSSYAVNSLGACIGAPGDCAIGGDVFALQRFSGLSNGSEQFNGYAVTPTWSPGATVSFSGTHLPGTVSGSLTIANLAVSPGAMDFFLGFTDEALFAHRSVALGFSSQPDACDPALDPTCVLAPPVDMTGDVFADFTHSLVLRRVSVFDAAGNDITAQSRLSFASGLQPLFGPPSESPPPPVTSTPEPTTIVLFGTGLVSVACVSRRRRRHYSTVASFSTKATNGTLIDSPSM